jgi:hypothetical protein
MPQQELRDLAANDWRNDTPACLNTLASIMSAAVTVAELIVQSAPYIQEVKDMMKLNAKLAAEGKPHKTFKSEGITVPPGTVVSNHGEDKPVLEDDPIGWLNTCPVVFRYTARHVTLCKAGNPVTGYRWLHVTSAIFSYSYLVVSRYTIWRKLPVTMCNL